MKFLYITNEPEIADIALDAGVDILFVDMEYIGKELRQKGMNSVKNHHTCKDINTIRNVIDLHSTNAELLARVNPLHDESKREITDAIASGADIVMLPMWKTVNEVEEFISIVKKKAKVYLLLETKEAAEIIDEVVKLEGIDTIYVGLNDLHLSCGNKFMFEPLANGMVDRLAKIICGAGISFGFGGIAKIGEGDVPAEKILGEHVRLGSGMVILSRTFCNSNGDVDLGKVREDFIEGIKNILTEEERLKKLDKSCLLDNHDILANMVNQIIKDR